MRAGSTCGVCTDTCFGSCGHCHEKVCSGHSAICIRCRIPFCVDKVACLSEIADYCGHCYQPLCTTCEGQGCLCHPTTFDDDEEEEEDEDEDDDEDDDDEWGNL